MPEPDYEHKDCPEYPARPEIKAHEHQCCNKHLAHQMMPVPYHRKENVAPVELGKGEHIEEGDQDPEPCGDAGRVEPESSVVAETGPDGGLENPVDQRLGELEVGPFGGCFSDPGGGNAVGEKWDQRHEPGDGAGGPDIKQLLLVADRVLDADDGAEGADAEKGHRKGYEEWRGGREAVVTCGEIVAKLVAGEDRQQRYGELEPDREEMGICQQGREPEVGVFLS